MKNCRAFGKWGNPLTLLGMTWLAALLSGCTPESSPPLRVGINSWPGYEFIYLAQEKGFYRDEEVEVRILEFSSLSDARRGYERGQLDVLGTTIVEVLQAEAHSGRVAKIVQAIDVSDGADVILGRPGLNSIADLRGARIGVELASVGTYVLARGLGLHGLGLQDVKPMPMDQLSMQEAFQKGELDAVVAYPPTSIKLQGASKANVLFSTKQIPGEVVDVIAVDSVVLQGRPEQVQKFLRAYQRAIRYAQQHELDAYQIMAAREGISVEEFASALRDGIRLLTPEMQAEIFREKGTMRQAVSHAARVLSDAAQSVQLENDERFITADFARVLER